MGIKTIVVLALLISLGTFLFMASSIVTVLANRYQISTDDRRPALVSQNLPAVEFVSSIGGQITTVAVTGNTAYVGEGASLTILDVSDPSSPTQQARLPLPDLVENIHLADDLLYIANLDSGLQIVDARNQSEPLLLGRYDTPGVAVDVLVTDQRAYIADGNRGLQIVDVSNPAEPEKLGSYEVGGFISGLQLVDNKAFLTDFGSGLYILDISQPDQPVQLNYISELDALDVQISANFAYLVGRDLGLSIFDFTDPLNPMLVGSYTNSGVTNATELQVMNNIAYLATYGSLVTIDVSNPTTPTKLDDLTLSRPAGLYISDNMAYVANDGGSVEIIDISHSTGIKKVGQYRAQRLANAIDVKGDFAYVADSEKGFQVIDISDPAKPVWLVRNDYPGGATDIALKDTLAYVAKEAQGLQIFDISLPFSPTLRGNYPHPVNEIELGSNLAYAVGDGQLQILDLSNPISPTLRATYSGIDGISVSGSLVFGRDQNGFQIIDVSKPDKPHFVGRYTLPDTIPEQPFAIAVKDNAVYLTTEFASLQTVAVGLRIIDASNPAEPTLSGTVSPYNGPVNVINNYLYIANGLGLKTMGVLEASSPNTLKPRASYLLPDRFNNLALINDLAYVADRDGGVQILRIHFDRFAPDVYLPLVFRHSPID